MLSFQLLSARVCFTERLDGDMRAPGDSLVHPSVLGDDRQSDCPGNEVVEARRRRVVDSPWTWLRQVHGAEVIRVSSPGDGAGHSGDAAVTSTPGCALAVLTADCAPVALASPEGVVGMAHAGWAGLEAGVLEATVDAMRGVGATRISALLGPRIDAECYEFASDRLDTMARRWGGEVRSQTRQGASALSLSCAVAAVLASVDVDDLRTVGPCTSCSDSHFSWRARRDRMRQAGVIWRCASSEASGSTAEGSPR